MSNQAEWQPPTAAHALGTYSERTLAAPWPFPLSVLPGGGIVRNVIRPPGAEQPAVAGHRSAMKSKKRIGGPEAMLDWTTPVSASSYIKEPSKP